MFVQGPGISFDIKSDFNHQKPIDAVALCLLRLENTMTDLKKMTKELTHG